MRECPKRQTTRTPPNQAVPCGQAESEPALPCALRQGGPHPRPGARLDPGHPETGCPWVDAETIEAIEAQGVGPFLAELQEELKAETYRPQAPRPARRKSVWSRPCWPRST